MERSILLAWVAGLGLLTWRELQQAPWKPPPPGRYLAASGLYAALGLLASAAPGAAPVAALTAWGFDLALFLQVLPQAAGGPVTTQQSTNQAPAPEGTQTV
jgi:hypothetical protein